MKLDSKYFDMIRASRRRQDDVERAEGPCCQWRGCGTTGVFRAPKGRGRDGEFFLFCEDHVRQYNASYNYFDGMSDAEVADFQKESLTGHRPTWKVGANAWAHGIRRGASSAEAQRFAESRTRKAQGFHAWRARHGTEEEPASSRKLRPLERKSLDALDLQENPGKQGIKNRFKELVKRHHPDLNGGDRSSEDKLREIIQAYNYLKQAGLV